MKISKKKISYFVMVAAVLAFSPACTKSDAPGVCLKIRSVTTSLTKAAVKSEKFPTADAVRVGLFIAGDDYAEQKYKNFVYCKAAGSDEWSFQSPVELQQSEGTLYGYYPWKEGISDLNAVPVSSSIGGDDWMWAEPSTVSASKDEVDLKLHHGLSLVELNFNITGASSDSRMTEVSISSDAVALSASMDIGSSGTLSGFVPEQKQTCVVEDDVDLGVCDGKVAVDCLLVPRALSDDTLHEVTVSCVLDGNGYRVTIPKEYGVKLRPGVKSSIKLNIKDAGKITVSSVTVSEWSADGEIREFEIFEGEE